MIYINFVELHCLMLHAKFQNHRPSGYGAEDFLKVFAIYSHGGHLGHVTLTIYTNFLSPFPRMLRMKFGFVGLIGQAVSGEMMFHYYGNIHVYMQGQTTPQGLKFSININLLSICLFPVSFTH